MVNKSVGVTATERLLAQFCERSFLRLWSYAMCARDPISWWKSTVARTSAACRFWGWAASGGFVCLCRDSRPDFASRVVKKRTGTKKPGDSPLPLYVGINAVKRLIAID